MSAQNEDSQVMERAPWQMFAAIFKKKSVVGEKGIILPSDFKISFKISILLKISYYGRLLRDTQILLHTRAWYAQTRIADTISIKISCAWSN